MDSEWGTSSYTGGENPNCVECRWQKSSYSGRNPECVETRTHSGSVHIRDTKNRHQGHLSIPAREWTAFLSDLDRF